MNARTTLGLVWLLAASASFGQTFFGSIVGTVADPTGSAVPQANITLTNLGTAERRVAQSDSSGNYQFLNLVPGQYKVTSGVAFGAEGLKIFHPADLARFPKKDTLPVFVWGNGGCAIGCG